MTTPLPGHAAPASVLASSLTLAVTAVTGSGQGGRGMYLYLVAFPGAERIMLFTGPVSEQRYHDGLDADALQHRFGLPVVRAE